MSRAANERRRGPTPAAARPPERAFAPPPAWWLPALIAVTVLALVLRVGVIMESAGAPYHRELVLDASTYHEIAVQGDPSSPFWQPPLYPWFLRAIYGLAGPSPPAARFVQAALGALTVLLVMLLVQRLHGKASAAVAAGVAAALYGPLIYFDNELLPASLAAFLVMLWLWLLAGGVPRLPHLARGALAGVVLGAALILLPTLALAGLAVAVMFVRRRAPQQLIAMLLVAALPVVLVTWRNARFEPRLVPVSYNAGVNLWIGNNPDYPATMGIRPGVRWTRLNEQPRCEGGAIYRADESAWFVARTFRFVMDEPVRFLVHLVSKTQATLAGFEIGRNRDVYDARGESLIQRCLLWPLGFPFAVLWPLAIAGLLAARRARLPVGLPLAAALGVLAVSVIFFPTARYRLPAVPPLIVLAALGIPQLRRGDVVALGSGAVALGVTLIPPDVPRVPYSETLYEIGVNLHDRGRRDEAVRYFEQALAIDPRNGDLALFLGLSEGARGNEERARELFERTAQLIPEADLAWQYLATYHLRRGDRLAAERHLQRAAELNRCNRRARANLAQLLMDRGALEAAAEQIAAARAVYRRPDEAVERAAQRLASLRDGVAPPVTGMQVPLAPQEPGPRVQE